MYLIYINEIGIDYKGQRQYEFIFSEDEELEIEMDEWHVIPASLTSDSKTPRLDYIDTIGILKDTNIIFELIQNSDYFGVIDAVDGVIALGWEKSNFDEDQERLYFRFGESIDVVNRKLNSRNLSLINEEIKTM